MKNYIKIENLNFKYTEKYILENINISINKGECIGLLGSNGSGKTTLINCILGELNTEGKITLLGKNPDSNDIELKQNLGIVLDNDILLDFLTLNEYLFFIGQSYKIEIKDLKENIDKWIKYFELEDHKNRLLKFFSHGMRKKTQIIAALLNNPKILIVDEPTNGLDIEMIYNLKNLINNLKNKEMTIIISTHNLDFVESVCDSVAIISKGNIKEKLYIKEIGESLEETFIKEIRNSI